VRRFFWVLEFRRFAMADGDVSGGALGEAVPARRGLRGEYSPGPRLRVAIEAIACGEAKTVSAAAAKAGMTREGLSKALQRPGVKEYMREVIRETLGVGATRAARRMVELVESENAMAGVAASRFLLATGAGVVPPSPPAVHVSVTNQAVGYVIDLSGRPVRPAAGPVIEGEAEVVELAAHRPGDDGG
jgi:hypothetical protein